MDYIDKLELQTEEVKEVENLENHTIINSEPFSVNKYNGHTREFLALDGDYDDGFKQLKEVDGLGISCNVSKEVKEARQDVNGNFHTKLKDRIDSEVNEITSSLNERLNNFTIKLNNIEVDVRDFGAKGDGVTDDTQAIQNAIDFVYENYDKSVFNADWNQSGGIVNLKSGTFLCNKPIYLKTGVTIQGSTVDSCKIISNSNLEYAITNRYKEEVNGYRNVGIKNISIVYNGIYLLKGYNSKLENVSVYNSSNYGILAQLTVYLICNNIRIYGGKYGIEINGNAGGGCSTTCYMNNIWIAHCSKWGINLNGGNYWIDTIHFKNLIIEYCEKIGTIYGGSRNNHSISIENVHFEQNGDYLTIGDSSVIIKNVYCDDLENYNIVINSPTKDYVTTCNLEDIIGNVYVQNNDKCIIYHKNVSKINDNKITKYISQDFDYKTFISTNGGNLLQEAYKYFNKKEMVNGDRASFYVMITANECAYHGIAYLNKGNTVNLFDIFRDGEIDIAKNISGTIAVNTTVTNLKFYVKQII